MSRRNVYYAKRTIAKAQPDKYLCMLTHGRDPGAYCHLSLTGLWPGDPNFTVTSLAKCLRDLEQVPDDDDHTGDLSRTTSTTPMFASLLDQTAFKATTGNEGAVDSNYFRYIESRQTHAVRETETTFKKLPPIFMLQMDNSAKDNKNQHVLAFCSELVIRGVFEIVEINFLMVGHTHEDVDALISKVSARTINKDVLTLPALMAEVWGSEAMHPVPMLLEEVADYKTYANECLKSLIGHSQPIGFRFSMADNVPVYRTQKYVDGPWTPEGGLCLWTKMDGHILVPTGEPKALQLPTSHPRLGEVSPFIDNLTRFWPKTDHGTGFNSLVVSGETAVTAVIFGDLVVDVDLERELNEENDVQLQHYVGDPADRPKRAFVPLEDISEGKFVILRPNDDFEAQIPRAIWLGRAMGSVVRDTNDEHHGEFLVEWWRPRHRKSMNATDKERYSAILVGQKDWEKDPGYVRPQWVNASAAIYSWKYRSKEAVPNSTKLNPLAKAAIKSHFDRLDLEE
ncbi:hypothetical protein R1sor_006792 [Riccia sorocarpa]|uniref:DUF7869 domain-containing protein n=1 Tax=Riccia sorocarpa TaxID=122646 RepID=A0ABD3HQQ4_9MARC